MLDKFESNQFIDCAVIVTQRNDQRVYVARHCERECVQDDKDNVTLEGVWLEGGPHEDCHDAQVIEVDLPQADDRQTVEREVVEIHQEKVKKLVEEREVLDFFLFLPSVFVGEGFVWIGDASEGTKNDKR